MISFLLKQLIFNGSWCFKKYFLPISYFLLIIHISINIYKIIKKRNGLMTINSVSNSSKKIIIKFDTCKNTAKKYRLRQLSLS